jgi:putative tryptophan/tyrosine transport system substrate-binding protein
MPFDQLRRREVIKLLGGAAAAWPLMVRAQQPVTPVIGFLGLSPPRPKSPLVAALLEGVADAGYVAGQNVAIEFRWANFQAPLLPGLAAELVGRQVAVIVTQGSPYAALAAKAATSTIPIVFEISEDPVKYGLVASLNRPGGNVTGITSLAADLAAKRLDLLLKLVPQVTKIGYLSGPSESPVFEASRSDMFAAGRALGREIIVLEVRRLDFEAAFATAVEQGVGALMVGNYTLFGDRRNRDKILELAAHHKIPAMYPGRSYVNNGGLMSYDRDIQAGFHQVGADYVGRILNGAKPPDLPVQQPTKVDLVINLKTAKALDLTVPRILLATASDLIE